MDLGKQAQFPPSIIATPLRPDIVIWSKMARVVVLIELTCCAEEGVREAQLRKQTKYIPLVNQCNQVMEGKLTYAGDLRKRLVRSL